MLNLYCSLMKLVYHVSKCLQIGYLGEITSPLIQGSDIGPRVFLVIALGVQLPRRLTFLPRGERESTL